MKPHLHVIRVPDCPLCPSLDTGPWCSRCQIHRAALAGGLCPGCIEDGRNEHRAATR